MVLRVQTPVSIQHFLYLPLRVGFMISGKSMAFSIDLVYSGERCDITTEKLALESKYIIAIVCGIGAVFIIIFIVICVVCKRRQLIIYIIQKCRNVAIDIIFYIILFYVYTYM
jgi:hypothetical protein